MECPICSAPAFEISEPPNMTKYALHARGMGDLIGTRCIKCLYVALNATINLRKELDLCEYCGGQLVGLSCLDCGTQKSQTH